MYGFNMPLHTLNYYSRLLIFLVTENLLIINKLLLLNFHGEQAIWERKVLFVPINIFNILSIEATCIFHKKYRIDGFSIYFSPSA